MKQFSPHMMGQARERFHQRLRGTFRVVVDTGQLRTLMSVCDLSYRQLADRTDGKVSAMTVWNAASGEHSPTMATMRAITRALLHELAKAYGGELSESELLELLTDGTPEARKSDLWAQLANEHRDRHEETGLPANERLAG